MDERRHKVFPNSHFIIGSFLIHYTPAVGNLWPSQPFYAAHHMIWKLAIARRETFSATAEHIDKLKRKPSQKNILMVQKLCRCERITLKSRCCVEVLVQLFKPYGI
jgi:hypothetical protein